MYALARRVDDIADGDLPNDRKIAELGSVRELLDSLETVGDDPVAVALTDASIRFPIPYSAFSDLVDGVEMDVSGASYETFDDLLLYCRRVAGSIGRLSLSIFGSKYPELAESRAEALGVAFQLTNILRDIREDYERGRVYLPAEDLDRFGSTVNLDGSDNDDLIEVIAFEAERAREWFGHGMSLLPLLQGRTYSCVAAAAGIYRRILRRIERRPGDVLSGRVALPTWEKAWVAARSTIGGLA